MKDRSTQVSAISDQRGGSRENISRIGSVSALAVLLFLQLLLLTGCEGIKSSMGVNKNTPDEFTVLVKAPLILPPDYTLRPPEPGAPRPNAAQPRSQASRALFPKQTSEAAGGSTGELALLRATGANRADPGIRKKLEVEGAVAKDDGPGIAERILFWQDHDNSEEPLVDARAEADRLKKNKKEGKSPVEGEIPVVQKTPDTFAR